MKTICQILLLSCVLALSCQRHGSGNWSAMSEAASIMEGRHEEAYAILDSLDTGGMNRRESARYSLLMSMALDKKYIDLTTDSLIAPAVKYYRNHGTADEKLKTAFYHSRILENAGDTDAALKILLEGERYAKKADDHLFIGRYYVKKSQFYGDNIEWRDALDAAVLAAGHSRQVNDYRGLATALLTASTSSQLLHEDEKALSFLSEVRSIWNHIDDHRKGDYYRQMLNISIRTDLLDAREVYSDCIAELSGSYKMPYIALTDYYLSVGDAERAREALNMAVSLGQKVRGSKEYELRNYQIEECLGDYEASLQSLKRYDKQFNIYEDGVLASDARFMQERIDAARKEERSRMSAVVYAIVLSLFLVVFCFFLHRQLVFRSRMAETLRDAEEEKARLESMVADSTMISEEALEMLTSRINLLNDMIITRMSGGRKLSKMSDSDIESLAADKDSFLMSLTLLFSISHPDFVKKLKEYGLTDWEIGFCCLYVMGLNGKEISSYILGSNCYNISSSVRQKLGIARQDGTLSQFLWNLVTSICI